MSPRPDTQSEQDAEILITAAEVYPELERAFLNAQREIWAGFRVFDLSTRLRSDEAREVGEDWFDLVVHVLRKGVAIHMALSDFDPILGRELHCESWKARRAFIAAGEVAGPDARLDIVNAIHSAQIGWLPRIALWPRLLKEIGAHCDALNDLDPGERAKLLECSPGLREYTRDRGDGTLRPRRFPPPRLTPGTHHQKLAVFDRELLCIGGLDLDERRYDDKGHHRRRDQTWHDVQLMVRGPVVKDAQAHLQSFLQVVDARRGPEPLPHLLATISRRPHGARLLAPRSVTSSLADAHHALIRKSRRLIYCENQFFRDRRLAATLARAGWENPDLTLIMVLPGAPENAAFGDPSSSAVRFGEHLQFKCVKMILDGFGERAALCSPVRPEKADNTDGRDTLCGSPIVYVHAKVSVFDEDRAIVSSANLNGRSFYWDTEAGVMLDSADQVNDLRRRTFRHWLGEDAGEEFFNSATAVRCWARRAEENRSRAPADRRGFLVPYDVEPARRIGRPLPFVPDEMV